MLGNIVSRIKVWNYNHLALRFQVSTGATFILELFDTAFNKGGGAKEVEESQNRAKSGYIQGKGCGPGSLQPWPWGDWSRRDSVSAFESSLGWMPRPCLKANCRGHFKVTFLRTKGKITDWLTGTLVDLSRQKQRDLHNHSVWVCPVWETWLPCSSPVVWSNDDAVMRLDGCLLTTISLKYPDFISDAESHPTQQRLSLAL